MVTENQPFLAQQGLVQPAGHLAAVLAGQAPEEQEPLLQELPVQAQLVKPIMAALRATRERMRFICVMGVGL